MIVNKVNLNTNITGECIAPEMQTLGESMYTATQQGYTLKEGQTTMKVASLNQNDVDYNNTVGETIETHS